MLDQTSLTDHWLVRAIGGFGEGRWELVADGAETAVFVLVDAESSEWPATVSVVSVADADWPSEAQFADMGRGSQHDVGGGDDGTVRLSHLVGPEQALTFCDVRIAPALPGSPLKVEMWVDVSPRLNLVASAAGRDLYELGRLVDSLTDLVSGVRPGVDAGRALDRADHDSDGV